MQHRSRLFNQFSLRQVLGVMTLTAGVAAILRYLGLDNGLAYALLLAPALLYVSLRVTGIALRPCLWAARRPGLTIGIALAIALLVVLTVQIRTASVFLPIAGLWGLQLAIVTMVEDQVARRKKDGERDSSSRLTGWDGTTVAGFCTFCFLLILCLSVYGMNHHIIGKGSAFGKYWMVVGSGSTTEIQWQDGYPGIPWQWGSGVGRATPAYQDRDWRFLGLERYRVGRIEKLRVPFWIPLGMLAIWPSAWGYRRGKSAVQSNVTERASDETA